MESFESNKVGCRKTNKEKSVPVFQRASNISLQRIQESAIEEKSKPNIVMILWSVEAVPLHKCEPPSTILNGAYPTHLCITRMCFFHNTSPLCLPAQSVALPCHSLCHYYESDQGFWSRSHSFIYRGGSAIRQQTRQESFCTLSIENRFKSASSQEHFSPRSCSWVGHGGASRVLWVRACKEPLMGHLRYSLPSQEPRMRSLRSIRVPLVTVLSGHVCPRGFRKAQMLFLYERCLCLCVPVNVFVFVCLCIPVYVWWVQVSVWCVYLPVVWPSLIPLSYLGSRLGATFPQVWSGITRLFDDKHFRWRNLLCAKVLYSRDRNLLGGQFFMERFDEKDSVVI